VRPRTRPAATAGRATYAEPPIRLADCVQQPLATDDPVDGEEVQLAGERFFHIRNVDRMPTFFMSLVSSSDLWMFVASNGGLTAGRVDAESALFPYATHDKLIDDVTNTGPTTVLLVRRGERRSLWEPFTERGFTPDSGATWLLPRLAGPVRARRMLLLGEAVTGREAADIELIHAACPAETLDDHVAELVARLGSGPTVALGLTKQLLLGGATAALTDQLRDEAFALELSSRSEDFREGLTAFREKRPPEFEGR